MPKIPALLLLFTLAALSAHADAPQTPEEHFDAAIVLLKANEPRDLDSAMEHLRVAAEKDYRKAQYALGKLYLFRFDDTDLPEDGKQAFRWLTEGAVAGDPKSQELLGTLYETGTAVTRGNACDPHISAYSAVRIRDRVAFTSLS